MKQEYTFNYQSNGKAISTNSFISYGLTSFKHKNSIVGKYFPEINSITLADKLTISER